MSLTRDNVLTAAVHLLDSYGLADLTMRRLGDELGVRAGALYHHVPNKQTLLAWVADVVVAEAFPQPPLADTTTSPWPEALTAWTTALRRALLSHRDSADLVATARAMGLCARDPASPCAAILARAGLSPADSTTAATAVLHFVLGHVAEEQARLDWERFGNPQAERGATDDTFSLGVQLLSDGIAARLA